MSDTPETDAEKFYSDHHGYYVVFAEHAEDLERERDVAQKAMGDARDILLDAMPDANAPTKILAEMIVAERDKYQEQADALLDRLGVTQERMIDAERKRDDLSNELNDTIRSCHIWQQGHSVIVADRDDLLNTIRVLHDDADVIVADRDYWRSEAERWREVAK